MIQVMATHHPVPEYREEWLAFMQQVIDAAAGSDGCLEFTSWGEVDGTRFFGLSRWESMEHFQAALPAIMALGAIRRPEWSSAEDEVLVVERVLEGARA